jgi:hypothetical protein
LGRRITCDICRIRVVCGGVRLRVIEIAVVGLIWKGTCLSCEFGWKDFRLEFAKAID